MDHTQTKNPRILLAFPHTTFALLNQQQTLNMMFRAIVLASLLTAASAQCSVCGEGRGVSAPDAIFVFPGQPAVACADLELAGENGQIPIAQCGFLPPIIVICECALQFESPVGSPVAPPIAPPRLGGLVSK